MLTIDLVLTEKIYSAESEQVASSGEDVDEQRCATKRCLQLHYLANASSTGTYPVIPALAEALFASGSEVSREVV